MNILIHGVGKTGTTALFYSIRQVLSGTVAELFEPAGQELFDAAFSASSKHILAKVILRETIQVPYGHFPWKIMTVRDPRDILISRLLYLVWHAGFRVDTGSMDAYLTLLRVKERDPACIPLKDLFSSFAAFQRQHPYREYLQVLGGLARQQALLASRSDFFVQRYEEFVEGRLQDLSAYLGGLDLDHRVKLPPHVARVERHKGYGDWRHWFTPDDVSFFRPMLAPAMQALGYEDDWELAKTPMIDPRYCSEYAMRLCAERGAQILSHWPEAPQSYAELREFGPEALLRLVHAPATGVSVAQVGLDELSEIAAASPRSNQQFVINWDGEPLTGDVAFQFYFEAEVADPLARLCMNFSEGFSERMSLILPAIRGNNLLLIRFNQPVLSLCIQPVNFIPGFLLRDLRLYLLR
jgi:hypothetical protein